MRSLKDKLHYEDHYVVQESALKPGSQVYFSLVDGVKQHGVVASTVDYDVTDSEFEVPFNHGEAVTVFEIEADNTLEGSAVWVCFSQEKLDELIRSVKSSPKDGSGLE